MALAEFYELRVSEFFQALTDWQEHQREKQKFFFDTVRLLATQTANINRGEHDPQFKPADVWSSPFEDEEQTAENFIDEAEQIELDKRMEKALQQEESQSKAKQK